MKTRRSFVGGSLALIAKAALGSATDTRATSRVAESLQDIERERITTVMAKDDIAGVAVCLLDQGEAPWIDGFGVTDRASNRPVTASTIFSIQSTSKNLTAVTIMLAVQRGLLDLDQPIDRYLPGFSVLSRFDSAPQRKITLRLLLSHRAGFTHEAPVGNNYEPASPDFAAHVRSISRTWLRYPVGDRYRYSNLGVDLAGYILQTVCAAPFARIIQDTLFTPLGMSDSTVDTENYVHRTNRAVGHQSGYATVPVRTPLMPSGGVYTSARDMAAYLRFHLQRGRVDGKVLLDESLWLEMHSFSLGGDYGLGVIREDARYGDCVVRTYSHKGGGFGFGCVCSYSPQAQFAWAAFFNRPTDAPYQFGAALQDGILVHRYGTRTPLLPAQQLTTIDMSDSERDQFVGSYLGRDSLSRIEASQGSLQLRTGTASTPLRCTSRLDLYVASASGEAVQYHYSAATAVLPAHLECAIGERALDYNDGPRDAPARAKSRWHGFVARYQIRQWGKESQLLEVHIKNGYLYLGEMRLIEHRPGLFFSGDGEALSFREPVTWRNIRLFRVVSCLVSTLVLCLAPHARALAQEAAKPQYGAWGVDLSAMNLSIKPGDDFNQYASGSWIARTAIPTDKPMASLRYAMTDLTEERLHHLMESAATSAASSPDTLQAKVGAFYKAFMDEGRIDKLGAGPLAPALDAIRACRDRAQMAALMGHNNDAFFATIFSLLIDADLKNISRYTLYATQAGLGLPDRDFYLSAAFAAQKTAYQSYISQLLTLIAWPDPTGNAAAIVDFETRIAQASWPKTEQRHIEKTYNPQSMDELGKLTPGFPWRDLLSAAGLGDSTRIVVAEKSTFPRISAIYLSTPLDVLKAWQAFTVTDNAAFYLPKSFTAARFEFRNKTLAGQAEESVRWKRAVRAVGGGDCGDDRVDCFGSMGFGVGQLYTATYFPPESKAKIEALVANVKAAMRVRLQRLDWMSSTTKQEALKKLDTYSIKVGYPDTPRDYSGLVMRDDDLVGDVLRAGQAEWRFYRSRANGPVDRSDWSMTPQTNDAYNGSLRDIVFPAAILQPPEFDPAADPAVNYGAIGAVIGHELTHGFDDEGRKLDSTGQIRDWWTAADAAAFEAKAKQLGAQYSSYAPVNGAHINGDLTMGENIADLGGLNVALEAYHRSLNGAKAPVLGGFSGDQRVFLGWAQAWRGKARDNYLRKQIASDPHSPRTFRVIGPTRNIDAWYDAFGVSPGDAYYLTPAERVRIW